MNSMHLGWICFTLSSVCKETDKKKLHCAECIPMDSAVLPIYRTYPYCGKRDINSENWHPSCGDGMKSCPTSKMIAYRVGFLIFVVQQIHSNNAWLFPAIYGAHSRGQIKTLSWPSCHVARDGKIPHWTIERWIISGESFIATRNNA